MNTQITVRPKDGPAYVVSEPKTVVDLLRIHYANRGNEPLSIKECAARHGIRWTRSESLVAEFLQHFVICNDGVIRTR